jgi:hypothetical protein
MNITRMLARLSRWLGAHRPGQCQVCFRWMWRKSAIYKQITTGGEVPLCHTCHESIFRPFTKSQRN